MHNLGATSGEYLLREQWLGEPSKLQEALRTGPHGTKWRGCPLAGEPVQPKATLPKPCSGTPATPSRHSSLMCGQNCPRHYHAFLDLLGCQFSKQHKYTLNFALRRFAKLYLFGTVLDVILMLMQLQFTLKLFTSQPMEGIVSGCHPSFG